MKDIVILGASGHAHVIADIIKAEGNRVIAFLDDDPNQSDCSGPILDYSKYPNCEFVIGIGNADIREKFSQLNLKWHTAIHPSAIISNSVSIGEGTVVMPNVVINAKSIIGKHCIINTGAIVEHNNYIGDYSHVSVGAKLGGSVCIGKRTFIGIGTTIKNNISICDDVVVGARSLVVKNIAEKGTYFGTPIKTTRNSKSIFNPQSEDNERTIKLIFTSLGRRVELIQAFRNASYQLGVNLIIYGADVSDTAPALFFCDKQIKICKIEDENYIPSLLEICEKEKIDAIIPTIDTDLLVLSQNKGKFEKIGTKVFVSSEDRICICRDKRNTADFFESVGLKSPKLFDDFKKYNLGFPAFIRPKDGSSSIDAHKVNNEEELELYSKEVPNYIVAPYINGTEYTVDAFCDYFGNPLLITPRIRLSVRAGEVSKTQIVQDERIITEALIVIGEFKPCGPITIQLIRQQNTNDDYFIEINPRFGGGAPLSMKAGADSSLFLLKILNNCETKYCDKIADDGAIFSRFDQSVRTK